jgi:hypothetical protein
MHLNYSAKVVSNVRKLITFAINPSSLWSDFQFPLDFPQAANHAAKPLVGHQRKIQLLRTIQHNILICKPIEMDHNEQKRHLLYY